MKYEGNDRQELRNTFNSKGWKIIQEEVLREVDRNKDAMMQEVEYRNMLLRQGQDMALEWFLRLKEDLLEEERQADEAAAAEVAEETP